MCWRAREAYYHSRRVALFLARLVARFNPHPDGGAPRRYSGWGRAEQGYSGTDLYKGRSEIVRALPSNRPNKWSTIKPAEF